MIDASWGRRLGIATLAVASFVFALVIAPASAQGDGPSPAPAPAAGPASVPANVAKQARVSKMTVTAAERAAVQSAMTASSNQFVKDKDPAKLMKAGASLSGNAAKLYQARGLEYLTSKSPPQAVAQAKTGVSNATVSTTGARAFLIGATVASWHQDQCWVNFELDLTIKNAGLSADPAASINFVYTFSAGVAITKTLTGLAPGATTVVRTGIIKFLLDRHEGTPSCGPGGSPGDRPVSIGQIIGVPGNAYWVSFADGAIALEEVPPN